jgi:hypothetical protein
MTYRSYRPDRRFRRRRWLLIVLTFIAVIAVIAYLVSRETEQRGSVEFFAAADESASAHASNAMDLEAALASIGTAPRQDLTGRLERITAAAEEADAFLAVEVPSVVGAQYGFFSTASATWLSGVTKVEAALNSLMDGDPVDIATQELTAGLDDLRAGDAAYVLFLASIVDPIDGVDVPDFPAIAYIDPDPQDVLLYDPTDIVLAVLSSYELAPHHNVGVTGQLDPSPVGDRGGIPLIPFSDAVAVTGVVTNSGNELETAIVVELQILNADTGETEALTQTIESLEGGASSSVTFPDLSITPGSLYQVKLTVTIVDDNRPEDDTWDLRFIRNEES